MANPHRQPRWQRLGRHHDRVLHRQPWRGESGVRIATVQALSNAKITPIFDAVIYATEEAIINAMVSAGDDDGHKGRTVHRLPHEDVKSLMAKRQTSCGPRKSSTPFAASTWPRGMGYFPSFELPLGSLMPPGNSSIIMNPR